MTYTAEKLRAEITRRAPWYQCIAFPDHGLTTTDNPGNALLDAAWDNKTEDISLAEAARLRPTPKWKSIQKVMPPVAGLDVLEIGSNCGFFSFEFARLGAKSVTGLDVAPKWLENAEWARSVLGYANVSFHNCDFMCFNGKPSPSGGLLSQRDETVPLPNQLFDVVFMSTVLDHLFFPLFAIYKMCRISRRWVVIDIPCAPDLPAHQSLARLGIAKDNSHHGFNFTPQFMLNYIGRLGIAESDIQCHLYNRDCNATYVIDVRRMAASLDGA